MAKQIIKNNAMFIVYTDAEREQAERQHRQEYNKVKDITTRTADVKIKKHPWGYVGYDKRGTMYPIKNIIPDPKQGQEYKVFLNEYDRAIKAIRI